MPSCPRTNHDLALRSRPPFAGVPRGPGRKLAKRVLFECFGVPGSKKCPKKGSEERFFWHSGAPKVPRSTPQSTLWGTPSQAPKSTPQALFGLPFGPSLSMAAGIVNLPSHHALVSEGKEGLGRHDHQRRSTQGVHHPRGSLGYNRASNPLEPLRLWSCKAR